MVTRADRDDLEPEEERPACATEARRARTAEEQIADEAADAYERDFWARGEQ